MYKTRRFKGLNGAKGKYSRIVDKIAVYDQSGNQIDCCVIHKDKDGREFYHPSNSHSEFGLFSESPKDAIECIRAGLGDGFSQSHLLGFTFDKVVRFIDREYGESIRQKTLEGWKNTKFAYGVSFGFLNSFSGSRKVCKNKSLFGYGNKPEDILTFDTEEAAQAFIEEVKAKAKEYANEYENLPVTENTDYDYENIHKPFFNQIEGKMESGSDSVYWMAFSGTLDERENKRNEYKMKVVQVILP